MKFKDKNSLVLAISAGLIVLAILISTISMGVEKKKIENGTTTTPQVSDVTPHQNKNDSAITSNTPGKYKVSTQNDAIVVRVSADPEAEPVYSLKKDTTVQVLATYDTWAYIEINDVSGWANLKYLELIEKSEIPEYAPGKYIVNTEETPLGMRERPSSDSTRYDKEVPRGEEVEILTVCGEWGYVEYEGYSGWLSFRYLKAK